MQDMRKDYCVDGKNIEWLGIHDHACLIYKTHEEQHDAVIPFIRIGLERGEKCLYIIDDNTTFQVLEVIRAAGIDVDSVMKSGALTMPSKEETYIQLGYFDPDWMIRLLKETIDSAKAKGYTALRVTGEMTWALDAGHSERLVEYEAKINDFFENNDIVAICQYNQNRFKPEIIADVIRTHPVVIYSGLICRNPYYVQHHDFLGPKQKSHELENILNNIIAWNRTVEALSESRERYRKLIHQSVEAIYMFDPETGRVLEANNAFLDFLGYTKEEASTLSVYDFVVDRRENIDAYVYHVLMSGATTIGERVWRRKDKTLIDVQVTANKIFHEGKDICFAIARDITGQKKAEIELCSTKDRLQVLSKRLLEILENERRCIARELHDDIGAELTLMKLNLQNMYLSNSQISRNYIKDTIAIVDRLFQRIHDLSFSLRPTILDDLGLLPALRWYINRLGQNANFNIRLIADPSDHAVPKEIETACFRVAQEALTNVARHANARLVTVELRQNEKDLKLTVSDDGIGFDFKSAQERAVWGESFGLLGMQERVILAGGTIEIESMPAKGTEVRVCFPLK